MTDVIINPPTASDCEDESLIVRDSSQASNVQAIYNPNNHSKSRCFLSLIIKFTLMTSLFVSGIALGLMYHRSVIHLINPNNQFDYANEMVNVINQDPHLHSLIAQMIPHNVTNSSAVCLNRFAGRFGNHIYQILSTTKYALDHNLQMYLPHCENSWMFPAQQPFQHDCPSNEEIQIFQDHGIDRSSSWTLVDPRVRVNSSSFHVRIDGYFQYHSSIYSDTHLNAARAIMQPHPKLFKQLEALHQQLLLKHCANSLIVGLHIRRGDFDVPGGRHSQIPIEWYLDWLMTMRHDHSDVLKKAKLAQDAFCPLCVDGSCNQLINDQSINEQLFDYSNLIIFLASDDNNVTSHFTRVGYNVLTSSSLQQDVYSMFASLNPGVNQFYVDWWLLTQLHMIATSHSTFSLSSALFNRHVSGVDGFFYWPDSTTMAIEQFNPRSFEYVARDFYGKNFSEHQAFPHR